MSSIKTSTRTAGKTKLLPLWKVILHDDTINLASRVVERLMSILKLAEQDAFAKMKEAHTSGQSVVVVTYLELAEFYQDQFMSCSPPLQVTIEPA